jgi:hypothetical protein
MFVDLLTADSVPPRAMTSTPSTKTTPRVRGDRLAYVDFAEDPQNPNGCVQDAHSGSSIVTTNISSGGRNVVRSAAGLVWLGSDRVWFPIGLQTAYQMLPTR